MKVFVKWQEDLTTPAKQLVARPDESLPDKWQAGVRTGAGPPKVSSGREDAGRKERNLIKWKKSFKRLNH